MVLVTGGTGLIGSHLLLFLIENKEEKVRAIYRNTSAILNAKRVFKFYDKSDLFSFIEWVEADLLDIPSLESAFTNVDYVYHCAALISFDPNDERIIRKTNIEGTANIVNISIDLGVKKLCYVSSIAALGDLNKSETIINEDSDWNAEVLHNDYGISKYGAEMEIWRGFQEGLKVVIVNPGVVLDPCFYHQGSGLFFSTIKKGFPFYTHGSTGYVGIADLINIMYKLMNSEINGERFIVISENIEYKEIINKIAIKINARPPFIKANSLVLGIGWRLDWFFSMILRSNRKLSKHTSISLVKKDLYSNKKIISLLHYNFQKIDNCIDSIAKDFNRKK